jgi:hypothetical protein
MVHNGGKQSKPAAMLTVRTKGAVRARTNGHGDL